MNFLAAEPMNLSEGAESPGHGSILKASGMLKYIHRCAKTECKKTWCILNAVLDKLIALTQRIQERKVKLHVEIMSKSLPE